MTYRSFYDYVLQRTRSSASLPSKISFKRQGGSARLHFLPSPFKFPFVIRAS